MQGAVFCHPDKIFIAPIWDNPMIKRNKKAIKISTFPDISQRIKTLSDFYKAGSSDKLSKMEMENKFQILINEETLIEMHFIIDSTFRSLGTNARNFESPHLPCQPLLINVLNMSKKGCSVYSNLLKKREKS